VKHTVQKNSILTEAKPGCYLCGGYGEILYRDCKDCLFGAPGSWTLKRCPGLDCGLIWLDPMPTRDEISKAYLNYYTHKKVDTKRDGIFSEFMRSFRLAQLNGYLALRYQVINQASTLEKLAGLMVYLQPARKATFDFKAMYIPVKYGSRLLEIGCGSGEQLEFLHGLGWQAEGLDTDTVAASVATARGLIVHTGSLEEQCFPEQQFDVIVSSHVIEHVHDPVGLLRECRRVLSPDGKLVFITPNTSSWGHKWFGASWLHLDPPRHLHLFNPVSLRRTAEDAGFSVCTLTSTVRDADSVFRASYDIRNSGRHAWGHRHSWSVLCLSKMLQWWEWLLLQTGVDRGEELMMVCEPGSNGAQGGSK